MAVYNQSQYISFTNKDREGIKYQISQNGSDYNPLFAETKDEAFEAATEAGTESVISEWGPDGWKTIAEVDSNGEIEEY